MDLIPVIDHEKLQEAVNTAALKGAIATVDKFYNDYDSPFRKQIREALESKGVSIHFQLPDIVALVNVAIGAEIDRIANNAIAATFLPMVQEVLTRTEGTVQFSDILKKLVHENSAHDRSDFDCDTEEGDYGWLNVKIRRDRQVYAFTLHKHRIDGRDVPDYYRILSLPRLDSKDSHKMTIFMEDLGKVELPFVPELLRDRFISHLANLVLNQTVIHMDSDHFDYDWFETCHCH